MDRVQSQKTVLVTGAAGFVGSHLVAQLLHDGYRVIGVDNFLTGRAQNLAGSEFQNEAFSFIEADVTQPPDSYLPKTPIDAVLHFASPASPPRYQAAPVATYLVNALGTHLLCEYLRQQHPKARLLFASTSEVYGDPGVHPQPETYWGNVNPNGPRSCYDESKRMGETVCGVMYRDHGLDTRIVRIFNTYGPRMDPADGRVIPSFLEQSLSGKKLTLHGDGQQTRSYCYVSDLVSGILTFLWAEDLAGETINIGNPEEHTVRETAEIVYRLTTGQTLLETQIEFLPRVTDDPTRRQPDISKAQRLLQWQPQISFEVGLAKTLESLR